MVPWTFFLYLCRFSMNRENRKPYTCLSPKCTSLDFPSLGYRDHTCVLEDAGHFGWVFELPRLSPLWIAILGRVWDRFGTRAECEPRSSS